MLEITDEGDIEEMVGKGGGGVVVSVSRTRTQSLPVAVAPGASKSLVPLFVKLPITVEVPSCGLYHEAFTIGPEIFAMLTVNVLPSGT